MQVLQVLTSCINYNINILCKRLEFMCIFDKKGIEKQKVSGKNNVSFYLELQLNWSYQQPTQSCNEVSVSNHAYFI